MEIEEFEFKDVYFMSHICDDSNFHTSMVTSSDIGKDGSFLHTKSIREDPGEITYKISRPKCIKLGRFRKHSTIIEDRSYYRSYGASKITDSKECPWCGDKS